MSDKTRQDTKATLPARHDNGQAEPRGEHRGERQAHFRRGIEQFNAGRFFDAHETWEEIWLKSPEPEKTFLQGIIQIAAAFHHYGKSNPRGTCSLIEAGLRRLARFPPAHSGIALEPLRAAAGYWANELAAGRDPGPTAVPRINLSDD